MPTVAEVDFSRLLPILNNTRTQKETKESKALYQVLYELIKNSQSLKDAVQTQVINQISGGGGGGGGGGIGDVTGPGASTDNAIARFHGGTGKIIQNSIPLVEDDGRISTVTDPTGAQDAATKAYVDVLAGQDFLTHSDESAALPNSRELLAGTNITFDDTVANERTVNAVAGADYVVMSDGGVPPQPMTIGANFVYIPYTP